MATMPIAAKGLSNVESGHVEALAKRSYIRW